MQILIEKTRTIDIRLVCAKPRKFPSTVRADKVPSSSCWSHTLDPSPLINVTVVTSTRVFTPSNRKGWTLDHNSAQIHWDTVSKEYYINLVVMMFRWINHASGSEVCCTWSILLRDTLKLLRFFTTATQRAGQTIIPGEGVQPSFLSTKNIAATSGKFNNFS